MNIQPCNFDITAYRTQELGFQVSQLIMTLDDKSAPFKNHGMVYSKSSPQTHVEGISSILQL